MISLSYGAPVTVDAGGFSGLFLVKHCLRGAAQAIQGRRQGEWREGETMLLSAGADTQLLFDQACAQQCLRLDIGRMERLCVTDIALRFGFLHLGRFSAYYEARFGERPSVTLRRSSKRLR